MMMMMEEEEEENQHPKENEEAGEGKDGGGGSQIFLGPLTHSGLCWWLYDVLVGKPDDKKEKGGDKADEKVR